MLPGFGYRFLRQRRQHKGPSTERGIFAISRAVPPDSPDIGIVRGKFRTIAADRSENGARMFAVGAEPAAIAQRTPRINLRPPHQKTGEVIMT